MCGGKGINKMGGERKTGLCQGSAEAESWSTEGWWGKEEKNSRMDWLPQQETTQLKTRTTDPEGLLDASSYPPFWSQTEQLPLPGWVMKVQKRIFDNLICAQRSDISHFKKTFTTFSEPIGSFTFLVTSASEQFSEIILERKPIMREDEKMFVHARGWRGRKRVGHKSPSYADKQKITHSHLRVIH